MFVCGECKTELSDQNIVKESSFKDLINLYGQLGYEKQDPRKYVYVTYKGDKIMCDTCKKLMRLKLLK